MQKQLLVFFILINFTFLTAQTSMNLNLKDGSKVTYELSEIAKINFSGITGLQEAEKISHVIKSFKLLQNYPNPFNPSTTIQYEIPKSGKVEVLIYDIAGGQITELLSETQQAGQHKKIWNGRTKSGKKASSGFYIYTVKFENRVYSKKMILIK